MSIGTGPKKVLFLLLGVALLSVLAWLYLRSRASGPTSSSLSPLSESSQASPVSVENIEKPESEDASPSRSSVPTRDNLRETLKKNLVPADPPNPSSTHSQKESPPSSGLPVVQTFGADSVGSPLPRVASVAGGETSSSGGYNPDPGAYLHPPVETKSWLPSDVGPMYDYGREPLPRELELPRKDPQLSDRILPKFPNKPSPDPRKMKQSDRWSWLENVEPSPSRWDVRFGKRARYIPEVAETTYMYETPRLWHPYEQSILKGDLPILGEDVFLNITTSSATLFESQRIPTPSALGSAQPDSAEFFGEGDGRLVQQNFFLQFDLFQGETVFRPVTWLLRVQPVYNINYAEVQETTALSADPRGEADKPVAPPPPLPTIINRSNLLGGLLKELTYLGGTPPVSAPGVTNTAPPDDITRDETDYTRRYREDWALQQAFLEIHLRDWTDNYDFLSSVSGIQPFNSDFRGLVFNDVNLGARLVGNAENNLWQYNVGYFNMREKDTNSELNTFDERNQEVFVANVFRQDFLTHGYTAELNFLANIDNGNEYYDKNGFVARPAAIGSVQDHDVRAYYVGFLGEGKWGRVNISHSFYQVWGTDEFNGISGRKVGIDAQQAHLELSYDRDWIRFRGTALWASGDNNSEDSRATGFDSIIDNPNLFGSPFSFYGRQGFNLGGSAVRLKQRNSLIPNLRSSKFEGQSNFVNPGVLILGLGTDIDLIPEVTLFLNANYIRFGDTTPIRQVLFTNKVSEELGYDFSIGCVSRPLLTDNIIFTAGLGLFLPGAGYRDIYHLNKVPIDGFDADGHPGQFQDILYSAFVQLQMTW